MGSVSMMLASKFIKKANQIRKQNWSAPTIMTAFIIVCMFMVYSFETIGILNKERNINFRLTAPERVIKSYDIKNGISSENEAKIEYQGKIVSDKLKNFSLVDKEKNLEKIREIMMQGALEQIAMEMNAQKEEQYNNELIKEEIAEEQLEFFDI